MFRREVIVHSRRDLQVWTLDRNAVKLGTPSASASWSACHALSQADGVAAGRGALDGAD